MKSTEILLDQDILASFQHIFDRMSITGRNIQSTAMDLDFPPLTLPDQVGLEFDGLGIDEGFLFNPPEYLAPQLHFTYKRRPVVVYQREQFLTPEQYAKGEFRVFHLTLCQALRNAKDKNMLESRYVTTYNLSGDFKVSLNVRDKDSRGIVYTEQKEQNVRRRLKVCQDCLREINWKNFRKYCGYGEEWWRGGEPERRSQIVENFNLEEYFLEARKSTFFSHPVAGTASSATKNEYVLSPQMKEALKKIQDYTCEVCHENFPSEELQIHHRNHNAGDNLRENLMVVCCDCHALIHEAEGGFVNRRKNSSFFVNQKPAMQNPSPPPGYVPVKKPTEINIPASVDELYAQRKFDSAFVQYKKWADIGNVRAKIRVGLMYAKGLGIRQNFSEAKIFLESARKNTLMVDSELVELCALVGDLKDAQKLYDKALQLFRIAAKHGDTAAKMELERLSELKELVYEGPESIIKVTVEKILELKKLAADGDEKAKATLIKLYYDGRNTSDVVVLRDSMQVIAADMFKDNENLREIILPANLISIGDGAFSGCTSLRNISLPDGVTSIGANAFADSGLTEINFPDSVTSIGEGAFAGSSLSTITLPKGLTAIAANTFSGCSKLKRITFPDNLTSIGDGAFRGSRRLGKKLLLPENVVSIGNGAFQNCRALEKITFPRTLNFLGNDAFKGCQISDVRYFKSTTNILRDYFGLKWDRLSTKTKD